jgi:RNA polymerase sigma-70 factor (ECF subfamily)
MSGPPLRDDELLARHVAGDPDAFGEIVARHRDRLWAVALRTLGQPEDAADALQDALLSAYRGAAGFRGGAAVTTWLHRIVVNACLDLARRRAVRPTEPLRIDPVSDPSGRDRVSERETSLAVLAALRSLPPEQAAAVVLVDIEGYPVNDVAEMLEVPAGTVKSRCARARARLAEALCDLNPSRPVDDGPPDGKDRDSAPADRDGDANTGNDAGAPRVQPEAQYGEEPA